MVKPFADDMGDYTKYVLDKADVVAAASKAETATEKPQPARASKGIPSLKKHIAATEEKMTRFQTLIAKVDAALSNPEAFTKEPTKAAQLAKQRGELADALAAAEEEWLELSSEAEAQAG